MQLSYNKATLYGNSIVDYVWIKNYVAEQSEIDTVSAYTYSPQWDDTTLMLAPFNSDINGGNVVGLSDNVIAWQIYKRKPDDSVFTFVAKVPAAQYKVSDFNVLNNDEYQYTIFAET